MVDTHLHAPQYPNAGTGSDLPLLKWLEKYTFPMESKYTDSNFAHDAFTKAVKR
jgi:guanine deaminase